MTAPARPDAALERFTGPITVRELVDDPERFILHYFPHRIKRLEPFHRELVQVATKAERGLVLYPAGHGKTTLISEILPIYRMCRDPDIRMLLVHKTAQVAANLTRATMNELQTNERLINDFGDFKPEKEDARPWSAVALTIRQRTHQRPTPTLTGVGPGSPIALGLRTDVTVCDDIVTTENSATEQQRAKMRQWFDLVAETGPEFEHSQLIVVGTRFHPADLYGDLMEIEDEDGTFMWDWRQVDSIKSLDEHKTLWPAQWTWARLMKQKTKLGTLEFNKRYRNIAVDPTQMVFREEYVNGGYIGKQRYPGCIDKHFTAGDFDPNWRMASGFDPAIGTKRTAKFCAHVVLAVGNCDLHERCIWVVDVHRDQYTLPQQIDLILDLHGHYGLHSSQIEANAYQMGLYQAVHEKMGEQGLAYRIEPHYTDRNNKPDPELGVEKMAPWFENGQVHIPWGDAPSRRKMQILRDELVMYPGKTTDTVMAMWFAWRKLITSAPRFQTYNRVKKPMAWRPRQGRRVLANPYYR